MKHYRKNEPVIDFYFWFPDKWCLLLSGNTQVFFYSQANNTDYTSCGNIPFERANYYYNAYSNSVIWSIDVETKGYYATYKSKIIKGIGRYISHNIKCLLSKSDYNLDRLINELKGHIPFNAEKSISFTFEYPTYRL